MSELREKVIQLMEDYKNRPSNSNKAYHGMLALITEEKRALLESIKKAATDTIRPGFLSPSEQKEAIAAQAYAMASMIDSLLASLSEREG